MFDNGYEFNQDFTTLKQDFDIKHVWTKINNPQANSPVEQLHQVILNMLGTKDIDNKFFDYIDPWGETIIYIVWVIRSYYNLTIGAKPFQSIFCRDIVFNLMLVLDWRVITAKKQWQVYIDNVQEKTRWFTHDYEVGNIVYV